jgi:molecular chaperone HscB
MSDLAAPAVTADLLNADFFTLLGFPRSFDLDQAALDARFRELQREVHPDRFAAADDAARRASMMLATQINEGYQTLRSPLKRATYLLSLAGVDIGAESNTAMSPAFLMLQMEWREQVADARAGKDLDALQTLENNISEAIRTAYADLSARLDALTPDSDTQPAVEAVRQLMFLEKLYEEIDNAIFDLEDL